MTFNTCLLTEDEQLQTADAEVNFSFLKLLGKFGQKSIQTNNVQLFELLKTCGFLTTNYFLTA